MRNSKTKSRTFGIICIILLSQIAPLNLIQDNKNLMNKDQSTLDVISSDWGEKIDKKVGDSPYNVFVGDVNNDGKNDILTANHHGNDISILIWNDTINDWNEQKKIYVGKMPWGVFVADLNNDEYNDIVVSVWEGNFLLIKLWNATLNDWNEDIKKTAGSKPRSVFVGDANNDGLNDIVVASSGSDDLSILIWNNTINDWNIRIRIGIGNEPFGLFVADANNDGYNDIVISKYVDGQNVILLWNTTTNYWDKLLRPGVYWSYSTFVEDVNNDGFNDIITIGLYATASILLWNATSNDWDNIGIPVGIHPQGLFVGDANNDGYNDIVVTNDQAHTLSILLWNATIDYWNERIIKKVSYHPWGVAIADVNNDDLNDIVVANKQYGTVSIFLWESTIDTTPPIITIEYQDGDGTDGNPGKWNVFAYDDESGINEDTITILIDGEFTGDTLGDYDVPNTLNEHTIRVEVKNNDAILGSESDSVIIIDDDTTYPDINYYYTGDGTDENPGEIIMTASDESGLSVDPSGTYPVPNSLGTHNFIFTATDNDNDRVDDALTRTITIVIDIIDDDVTAPVIDIQYIGSGFDDDPGYFEWNIFDIDSGINHINITVIYESTEGLDDYTMYLEGTEIGSWDLPPNLGIYTIRIFARDNDDDRTLVVDSLTTELIRDQEIVDDDVESPELSNLIIIPSIFEINVTFNAIDESGIGNISTFINGELIEPITQIQFGSTYSFIFENQWLFQSGASEVVVQVEDGDDDRPNDALASSITGTFENVLYPTYEYIIWQLEELKNYVDENLCQRIVRSLNRKLSKAQYHLYEAINYFEEGSITCALFHDYLAKLFVRFTEHRTEIFNRKGWIEDYHAEYIIDSLHEIRNNIVLLMGASTGEEQAYEIALIEVELLNLKDFIEDEIPCCVGRYLSAKITGSAKLLELALFKISMGYSIDCILEYTQCKLEHTITKINFLLEKCKIPEDVANYLIEKISSIIGDIEQIKNN